MSAAPRRCRQERHRGSALLLGIFFMISMFFIASAFVQLLPSQSRAALSDSMETTASMTVEAGIIEAVERMVADGPPGGTEEITGDDEGKMGNNWSYRYTVSTTNAPNVWEIESRASVLNREMLVATAHVTTDDFFGPMTVSGAKTDIHIHNKSKGVPENSQFNDPIHSNSEMKLHIHDNSLPDPGPLFDGVTYGDGKKKDISIKPAPSDEAEWARLVNGGEDSVHQAPDEWIADLSDKDDKDKQDDNVVNGADNPDSLYRQVLNGASEPKKSSSIVLPPGGGVYIPDKVDMLNLRVGLSSALQTTDLAKLATNVTKLDDTGIYTADPLYDANKDGSVDKNDTALLSQVIQVDFEKPEVKTDKKTGVTTTTLKNTWFLVLDHAAGKAIVVDNTGKATQHPMPSGIYYVDDTLQAIQGINLGQKTIVAEKKIDIHYKNDLLALADTEVTRSLIPFGTDVLSGDPTDPSRMTQTMGGLNNGISLVAGQDIKIHTHDKADPDLDSYYIYANLLAGNKIDVHAHDKGGADFNYFGSMMAEGEIKLHLHGKEDKGAEPGDFILTQDDGNMQVLGLSNTNFTLIHYTQRIVR